MNKAKVAYIVSDIDKALAFEWIADYLHSNIDLFFVIIGIENSELSKMLANKSVRHYVVSDKKFTSNVNKWLEIIKILWKEKPAVVHTHLWRANILGLTAAWLLRIPKRIYTRHHATIHYREYPSGLKWDKLCNRLATHIVAISHNVQEILTTRDKADCRKIVLIHHGFDFHYFNRVSTERIYALRAKTNLHEKSYPIVGVISRYTEWKGVQYIIPAFQELRRQYSQAHLVLANAHGDYEREIKKLLSNLPADSYSQIRFENDLASLYRVFDIFVHVPTDPHAEAFGQTYIEPLIVGVPCIFTLSGVAHEFVQHAKNALVVDFKNSEQILASIRTLLGSETLRSNLVRQGQQDISGFSVEEYVKKLENLYLVK
ncbi:glycosyltransferase family 4 protein [Ohtaekwangia kribbensis]|uniref:Glycosyltransferase family 4 protein n=1 Tax=Ohtaekwangia kribbensis TaxID=688913 RepID=A0ABW3K1V3_9BACT